MKPQHRTLAVLVTVIWGVNFVVIDEGLRDLPPLLLTALLTGLLVSVFMVLLLLVGGVIFFKRMERTFTDVI